MINIKCFCLKSRNCDNIINNTVYDFTPATYSYLADYQIKEYALFRVFYATT